MNRVVGSNQQEVEATMKIHVNRVPESGLEEHISYDSRPLDMDRFDVHLHEPFKVDAFITKVERQLVVRIQVCCTLYCLCARCLDEFSVVVRPQAVFSYTVDPPDVVDITEDVRQEILLTYPMIPVCQADCKGLCISCGQNWNHNSCEHRNQ